MPSAAPTASDQQQAFDEQLAGNRSASAADRHTRRNLARPRRGAREQQAGDVRAADEQDDADGGPDDEQRLPQGGAAPFLKAGDAQPGAVGGLIASKDGPSNAGQFLIGRLARHAGTQPADDAVVRALAFARQRRLAAASRGRRRCRW